MLHIIWYIIVGFVVGLVARAIMPGAQHLGFTLTTLLGIGGSIVGGLIGRLFSKPEPGSAFHPAGLILSIIGEIILLFVWGKVAQAHRAVMEPGAFGNVQMPAIARNIIRRSTPRKRRLLQAAGGNYRKGLN